MPHFQMTATGEYVDGRGRSYSVPVPVAKPKLAEGECGDCGDSTTFRCEECKEFVCSECQHDDDGDIICQECDDRE